MNRHHLHFPDSDSNEEPERTFDFSKFPNLQEVTIGVRWISGGLLWISAALSTINPTTSPPLSTFKLDISGRPPRFAPVHHKEQFENDLRLIDERVVQIERDFIGMANFTVSFRHPGFEVGLLCLDLCPFLTSPSALRSVGTTFSFLLFVQISEKVTTPSFTTDAPLLLDIPNDLTGRSVAHVRLSRLRLLNSPFECLIEVVFRESVSTIERGNLFAKSKIHRNRKAIAMVSYFCLPCLCGNDFI